MKCMENFLDKYFHWIIIVISFCMIFYFVFLTKENIETKAIIVTTGATVVYATLTYKLLDEQKRMIQKPRIQAIIDKIILPIHEKIEIQKKFLEDEDFRWVNEKRMYIGECRLNFSSTGEKIIYYNFKDEFPDVYIKIEKYDRELTKLKKKLDLLAKKIKSLPNFKKEIPKRFKEYTNKNRGVRRDIFEPNDENIGIILRYMTYNMQELDEGITYKDFWKIYGKELLKLRERNEVKDLREEIQKMGKKLSCLLENIHNDLEKTVQICGKKYGVIPKIKEW